MRLRRLGVAGRGFPRRSGLSLVELLVTMTILGVGLVGVASMFTTSYKTQVQAHFAQVATDTVVTRIEEMKAAGYNGIGVEAFPATFEVPELPQGAGTISYQPYPNATSPNQYLIQITVSWGGGRGIAGRVSLPLVLSNHS
ncbi:MAG: prepilin-type N-terminal cleavage/methylation domain-containing protein [Armatimonadetes bacterium]|nr:prepilin-type N-terminal cleavage/methylation domain-containing protein [Armatimonadota bacterium]